MLIVRLLLSFVFFCSTISVIAQRDVDVQHYIFKVTLSDNADTIIGKAGITVRFLKGTDRLVLDLSNVKKNKGMTVSSVNSGADKASLPFRHADDKLVIQLPRMSNVGDTATFIVRYRGIPSDGLIISKNKYRHRTFFADNWPNRGHNWIPCVDDPDDKASVEFIVVAPKHYEVVSNGIQLEESTLESDLKLTHWKEDVPIATKVMVIGVADFAVNLSGTIDPCIPIYSWVYPEDRDKGFYDFAQALDIMPFYIKYIGPYGYKKLANVQSKTIFGGLENANTIFYAENAVTGNRLKEDLLAHEIAHQWFGNMAGEKSFAHLWLSEGFATYMTILYMENRYGKDTALHMLGEDRKQVIDFAKRSLRPVVDETKDYMELLNANSYQKGGWVLHMLRRQLGDAVFQKCISTYYATYAGKNADTRDLEAVFEKVSGKDWSKFFQQWLYTPGIPVLEVKWKYNAGAKKIEGTVTQLQTTAFEFPLEIKVNAGSKSLIKTIKVSQGSQAFSIESGEKPSGLVLDPNVSLLFKGAAVEVK